MKTKALNFIKVLSLTSVVFFGGNTNSYATGLDISQTPLFLGASVQPNVFFLYDDSGSMDWELLTTKYWFYAAYDPDVNHSGIYQSFDYGWGIIDDGAFYSWGDNNFGAYIYMYSQENAYPNSCNGWSTMDDCTTTQPADVDWRFRSPSVNVTFFNPTVTYKPWAGPCGSGSNGAACADGSYTAARNNPKICTNCSTETRDLSSDGDTQGGAFKYEVWIDDSGFTGARPFRGDNFNETGVAAGVAAAPNGMVDLWDTHIRISLRASQADISRVSYDPHTSFEPGTQGLNESVVLLGSISTSACFDILGPASNVAAIHAQGAAPAIGATNGVGCRTIADAQTNVANWYQYSRRRMSTAKNAITEVMDAQPNFRYGVSKFQNQNTLFKEVPAKTVADVASHNLELKHLVYQDPQQAIGTDLVGGLDVVGNYFSDKLSGKTNPIKYTCQKNFQIVLTDGYWNVDTNKYGDVDGDGVGNSGSDIAYEYYKKDINTSMANNVGVDKGSEKEHDPDGDGKTGQHLISFTVAFGVSGDMIDADGDGWPDSDVNGNAWATADGLPLKSGDWGVAPGTTSSIPAKIDDLWHMAWNSNGVYAAASTPQDVVNKLVAAIINIAGRIGSASAVALNSGTLNANSRVYQASFDSNDWSGRLRSVPIQDGPVDVLPLGNPDGQDDSPAECLGFPTLGELCTQEWDAGEKLAARTASSRSIYTFSLVNNTGIEFKTLADLDPDQQTSLKTHPDTPTLESDAVGQARLDYIRGDSSNEGLSASEFRTRKVIASGKTKLGDIIHSAPAYVANPVSFIPNNLESSSYNAYKIAQRNRTPVVYVGANDGMLHAFDASTNNATKGEEIFAYIPGKLVDKLPLLTSQNYKNSHTYYVDGSPNIFDAFNAGWKTLITGSAGAGGQLIYALDITNPNSFSASEILWEFSDEPRVTALGTLGDIDMGNVIGNVNYARMSNGQWVVIFGNGFNNTAADGNVSTTGNAVIYIVDAFTGVLVSKFDTEVGTAEDPSANGHPNGISTVTPVDINGDFKADYLYAGDLFGNVWEIDVTASSPASWGFRDNSAGKPKPFFIATDSAGKVQPITTPVTVKLHPTNANQTLVYFGTGSYFQLTDATDTQTQTFYAIWNDNTAAQYVRSNLLEQKVLGVKNVTGVDGVTREFRLTTSADVDPASYKIDWTTDKGWFMDLPETGERVNVEPVLRGQRIIFVTLTPDSDPCAAGGTSWVMELNANDGSRLKQSPFDVNGDGIIDDLDIVNFASDANTITSGIRSGTGIVAKPGILNTKQNKELKFFSSTTGNIDTVSESVDGSKSDRQSWRQLR